ncbi:MAG: HDOD domain-containing protein [Candidatus Polarisedimenticolaceae bacterium]|nr:HDOD domain-containing protein [Candidatus Polarisedimenticolaceae bacterium]
MIDKHEFLETLQSAIQQNKITLPTLPEVALKVKAAVDRENSTAVEIAEIITTDAAISARLLQVANSPLYRGRVAIESVQMAVTRLGIRLVRSLVSSLIMQQIFRATSAVLDNRFRALWEESVHVAALSRVLSYQQSQLDSEQAMLAGLIHNIGGLPVLKMAENHPELVNDETQLNEIIDFVSPTIGSLILKNWEFPEALAKIPQHYCDSEYNGGDSADFVDLVIVARQQIYQLEGGLISLDKLGFEANVDIVNIEGIEEEVIQVEEILLC